VNPLLIVLVGVAFVGAVVVGAMAYLAGVSDERAKWVRAYKADYEPTATQCARCWRAVSQCKCAQASRENFS